MGGNTTLLLFINWKDWLARGAKKSFPNDSGYCWRIGGLLTWVGLEELKRHRHLLNNGGVLFGLKPFCCSSLKKIPSTPIADSRIQAEPAR